MIEVVFDSSIKYLMKKAKQKDRKDLFGGTSEDVVDIGFFLDTGDISGEVDGIERQNLFRKLRGKFDFSNDEQEKFFQEQREDLQKLLSAAENSTPIRIWKSNVPHSVCGFYFVCSVLRNINCKINVVSLPKYHMETKDTVADYGDWRGVKPNDLYKFLPLEVPLSEIEKQTFSDYWNDLVYENAPLRAIINGRLVSVPEDFYGFIIERNIPDDDFIIVKFIGELMMKYALGTSDVWYILRIEKMIEENKLMVVENKNTSLLYKRVLRKIDS